MKQYVNRKNEDSDILHLQETVNTVLKFTADSISCFRAFRFHGAALISLHMAQVSAMAHQFMIVVQFYKLHEKNYSIANGECAASLHRLNTSLEKKYPEWKTTFRENRKILKEIGEAEIFDRIRMLRIKAYAHADIHPLNEPLKFIYFTAEETTELIKIFDMSVEVFKNIMEIYDLQQDDYKRWYNDTRAINFLKNHKKYKDRYFGKNE